MVTTLLLALHASSPFGCFIPFWMVLSYSSHPLLDASSPFWMVIHYSHNFILNYYFHSSCKLLKLNSYIHDLAQGPFIKHLNTFMGKHMHNKFSTHFPSRQVTQYHFRPSTIAFHIIHS